MAKTILIVDDKTSVRTLVRDYLTAEGFRVATASNGRDALFVARESTAPANEPARGFCWTQTTVCVLLFLW